MVATIQQFAAAIKDKYPDYADVDDAVLTRAILDKYPDYRDQVTASVIEPPSPTPNEQMMAAFLPRQASPPIAPPQPTISDFLTSGRLTDRALAAPSVASSSNAVPQILPEERLTDVPLADLRPRLMDQLSPLAMRELASGPIGNAIQSVAAVIRAGGKVVKGVAEYLTPSTVRGIGNVSKGLESFAEAHAGPESQVATQIVVGARIASMLTDPQAIAEAVAVGGIGRALSAVGKAAAVESTLAQSPVTRAVAGNLELPVGGADALTTGIVRQTAAVGKEIVPPEIQRSLFNPEKGLFQSEVHAALDGMAEVTGQSPEQIVKSLPLVPPNPSLAMNVVPDEIAAQLAPDERHLFDFVTQPLDAKTFSEKIRLGKLDPDVRQFFSTHLTGFASKGPLGEELANGFQKADMNAGTIAGQWRGAAKQRELWANLDETQLRQARFLVRGDVTSAEALGELSPEVTKAAQGWTKGVATPAAKMAQELGLTIKDVKTGLEEPWLADPAYYFPKVYDIGKVKADMPRLAKWMVDTKQADSIESAKKLMAAQWTRFPERRMGHLETKLRLDLPEEYEISPLVAMDRYIEGASKRIGYAQVLGNKDQEVVRLLNAISDAGTDVKQITNSANLLLGTYRDVGVFGAAFDSTGTRKTIGLLRNVSVLGKMSLSILAQFPEFAASAARTTMTDMMKGVLTAFGKTGTDFNEKAGILAIKLSNATLRGLETDEAPLSGAVRTFLGPFISVDQWNKRAFGIAAKSQIERLAREYAETGSETAGRYLERYGINPELARRLEGNLPEIIIQRGVLKGLKDMALGSSAVRGTPFLDAPEFKAVSLFKGWATRYANFMGDFVLKEFKAGNPRPLVTAVMGGMAIGYPALKLRDVISGRKAPDEPLKQAMRVFFYSNGVGIMSDALLASSDKGKLLQLAVGPVLTDVAEGTAAITKSAEGRTLRPIGQLLSRRTPLIGYRLNEVLKPKPTQSLQEIFGPSAGAP